MANSVWVVFMARGDNGTQIQTICAHEKKQEALKLRDRLSSQYASDENVSFFCLETPKARPKGARNTRINYLYRDGSNYKIWTSVVVRGRLSQQDCAQIISCCEDGTYFIPYQVGLPENRFETVTDDDHVWFELDKESFEPTVDTPTATVTAQELTALFRQRKGAWDIDDATEHLQCC